MINRIKLEHLVELMESENYRDRFVAEYIQTKQRYEKLKSFNTKIEAAVRTSGLDNGVDEPLHDCPAGLLREQQAAMGEYLHLLEVRAVIVDIDLEDAINYYIQKALKAEKEYHGFNARECKTAEEIEREKTCCQKDCAPPCEEGIYNPLVELPDDVMSLEDTIRRIECLQKCRDQADCLMEACPWFSNEKEECCEDFLKTEVSCLYHLKKYAEHK